MTHTVDPITTEAIKLIAKQAAKGLAKYGQGVSKSELTLVEWLRHSAEEQADNLVYTLRAIKELETNEDLQIQNSRRTHASTVVSENASGV
jgi:hypothetical protein